MIRKLTFITISILLIIIGKYYFGDNFIENLMYGGCMDSGFCNQERSILSIIKALASVLFIMTGLALFTLGFTEKRKY